ncbi:NUDIX domain-containing protein [Patescibacteria group bacterium]|nr:NUDIX domain-containing protein [Patescibacteria group bacterium]
MNKNNVSVSAGIIVYRRTPEGIKFLLLYHGGYYWNFPKGKLAEGEKSFKAALREVEEETGLKPKDLRFRDWFRVTDRFVFYTKEKERIPRLVIYYLAETQKQLITIVPREHQGYAWFLYKDAMKMLKAPTLKRNLKRAYDTIVEDAKKKKPAPPMPAPAEVVQSQPARENKDIKNPA